MIIRTFYAKLKYKYGNRHFWCRGYYVDAVGKNAKKIQEYIQNQLKEDNDVAAGEPFDESLGDSRAGKEPL